MRLLALAWRNLVRHKTRSLLTLCGVAFAAATVVAMLGFDRGYGLALREDLSKTGAHLFVSTEGCPSVAASLLIRGGELPRYLTDEHLVEARRIPGVRVAAGYLISVGIPPEGGEAEMLFGISEDVRRLKSDWELEGRWFTGPDAAEVILGAKAAERYAAAPGDTITVASLGREVRVVGVLAPMHTHDDHFVFLPLETAQRWLRKEDQLTAVAVQAEDLDRIAPIKSALQTMPDAYVVPAEAMSDEILGMVGGAKALMASLVVVVLVVSLLALANTLIVAALERRTEFAVLRCLGASSGQLALMTLVEAVLLALVGAAVGIAAGWGGGDLLDGWIRRHLPYVPAGALLRPTWTMAAGTLVGIAVLAGAVAIWPAWRTARIAPVEALRRA